jgi:sialidase-1
VFTGGQNGYHTYRIPSIIVTRKGTLLAFCEGRKGGSGDAGDIDLLLRRSGDGGRTWSGQEVIWSDGGNTCGNPCPVVDEDTGTIWLLLTWNLGEDRESDIIAKKSRDTRRVWVTFSEDDGRTWAAPGEITESVKDPDWGWYATGPGVGIQIQHGPHRGRLVIPCDHSYSGSEKDSVRGGKGYGSHIIYSDDHGKSWRRSRSITPRVNECQVVELAGGRLLLNMRAYFGDGLRRVAHSDDGGETWSPAKADPGLPEPVCQASILRYTWPGRHGKSRILFSNPASKRRENMTVRLSHDEGKTWPLAGTIHAGPAAYSCLTVLPDLRIGLLYERQGNRKITFCRFSLEWLTGGRDSLK